MLRELSLRTERASPLRPTQPDRPRCVAGNRRHVTNTSLKTQN